MPTALEDLKSRLAEVNALRAAIMLMDWDQQTYMPRGGAEARAEHLGNLSKLAHEKFIADETRKLAETAQPNGSEDDAAFLRVTRRELDLATKLPTSLVAEKTKLAAVAHEVWVEARTKNDFASFTPILERMFEIARQEAEFLGYRDDIYDALLDQYEEGATAADVRSMFEAIKAPQVELVHEITASGPIDNRGLYGEWDTNKQREFTELLVRTIGFDFERGRQDTAPHPFCTGWSIGDIRLTTRFKDDVTSSVFSSLHEAGHGMYEQGTPKKWDLTPLAGGASLGVHESQSRLWENIVGRSHAFWVRFLPDFQRIFPQLEHYNPDTFYKAINKVEPSLIRVEADEVTYNLHVLVRFEIESAILKGQLAVKDLPEAWNAKYKEYLGVTPKNNSEGCLQDVHWSQGSIGYFPTYTMGNLLSYQIWMCLKADLGDVDSQIEQGDFSKILGWLREKIYSRGKKFTPKELILQATGQPMRPQDYLNALRTKYANICGF